MRTADLNDLCYGCHITQCEEKELNGSILQSRYEYFDR